MMTPRERQVLDLIVEGKSNCEIANELGIEVATVGSYVQRIFIKLGVSNRTQAAVYWLRQSGAVMSS